MPLRASVGDKNGGMLAGCLLDRPKRGKPLTDEMLVLAAARVGQIAQLLQQERVLENALDGLNQVGFQGRRVLLTWIARLQELLQRLRSFIYTGRKVTRTNDQV